MFWLWFRTCLGMAEGFGYFWQHFSMSFWLDFAGDHSKAGRGWDYSPGGSILLSPKIPTRLIAWFWYILVIVWDGGWQNPRVVPCLNVIVLPLADLGLFPRGFNHVYSQDGPFWSIISRVIDFCRFYKEFWYEGCIKMLVASFDFWGLSALVRHKLVQLRQNAAAMKMMLYLIYIFFAYVCDMWPFWLRAHGRRGWDYSHAFQFCLIPRLELFWHYFGIILVLILHHLGIILHHFGNNLTSFGNVLGRFVSSLFHK